MLTDASGTEFDATIHNIVDETLKPQLTSKGNFVKMKQGQSNGDELIAAFEGALAVENAQDAVVESITSYPDEERAENTKKLAEFLTEGVVESVIADTVDASDSVEPNVLEEDIASDDRVIGDALDAGPIAQSLGARIVSNDGGWLTLEKNGHKAIVYLPTMKSFAHATRSFIDAGIK